MSFLTRQGSHPQGLPLVNQVSILSLTLRSKAFFASSSPFGRNYFQDRVIEYSSFGGCVPLLLERVVDGHVVLASTSRDEYYTSKLFVRTAF